MAYTAPGVYFKEEQSFPSSIAPTGTSIPIFYGLAEWGPIHLPTKISNFGDFQKIFGGYLSYSDLAYCVDNFYKESAVGNAAIGGDAYIVRLTKQNADYTGIDTSVGKADVDIISATSVGTSAEIPALTAEAKYYGLLGNRLAVKCSSDPIRTSRLAPASSVYDLTASGITAGNAYFDVQSHFGFSANQVLVIMDGTNTEIVTVTSKETIVNLDNSITYRLNIVSDSSLDDTGAFVNSFTQNLTSVTSAEFTVVVYKDNVAVETWKQVSVNSAATNYFATVINDEFAGSKWITLNPATGVADSLLALIPDNMTTSSKLTGATLELDADYTITDSDFEGTLSGLTGMYAINKLRETASQVCYPNANATCLKKLQGYLESRRDLHLVIGVPASDTGFATIASKAAAIAWRDRNAFDSRYLSAYFPRIKVTDPIGVTSTSTREIDPCGHLMGLRNRVDHLPAPDGGIWGAPAGQGLYGTLYYVSDVAYKVDQDTEYGDLNAAGINCILARGGKVEVSGTRTLSSNTNYLYVPVSRVVTWIEQTVVINTRGGIFRANVKRWWDYTKGLVEQFLGGVWRSGGLAGDSPEQAYFVKLGIADGTMTQADIDKGYQLGKFGVAPVKPTEFIEWTVSILPGNVVSVTLV